MKGPKSTRQLDLNSWRAAFASLGIVLCIGCGATEEPVLSVRLPAWSIYTHGYAPHRMVLDVGEIVSGGMQGLYDPWVWFSKADNHVMTVASSATKSHQATFVFKVDNARIWLSDIRGEIVVANSQRAVQHTLSAYNFQTRGWEMWRQVTLADSGSVWGSRTDGLPYVDVDGTVLLRLTSQGSTAFETDFNQVALSVAALRRETSQDPCPAASETPPSLGACTSASPEGLMACFDASQYAADVGFVAAPRTSSSAHWTAVQALCAHRLAQLGYAVELHNYGTGVNVIGIKPGETRTNEQVLLSAHYDSVPQCDGADDNATGVAGVLEAARVLSQANFDRTLVVACWDEEEEGRIGSLSYAHRAADSGDQIVTAYVFDMIGYKSDEPYSEDPTQVDNLSFYFPDAAAAIAADDYRGDFIAIVADELACGASASLQKYAGSVGLPTIGLHLSASMVHNKDLADFQRSDHFAFWNQDVPAVMLTDTADLRNPFYHCKEKKMKDTVGTLDFAFAGQTVKMTIGAAAQSLGVRSSTTDPPPPPAGGGCDLLPKGASCRADADCCSGRCRGSKCR